ncbi:hypothetical protein LWI29_023866 [Acer saccharum]|uniref:Uncharacterized protein n=1 Tax=Acer saccharum TaxID=4024 RepID=A0AA39SMU5_ACESA|nr:hypothetical protein LWI29_023866 [Acer saccharum]
MIGTRQKSQDIQKQVNIIQEERNSSLMWDIEVEVAKVIVEGVALGYNFNRNEKKDVNEVDGKEIAGVVSVPSGIERDAWEVHSDTTKKRRGKNKSKGFGEWRPRLLTFLPLCSIWDKVAHG